MASHLSKDPAAIRERALVTALRGTVGLHHSTMVRLKKTGFHLPVDSEHRGAHWFHCPSLECRKAAGFFVAMKIPR